MVAGARCCAMHERRRALALARAAPVAGGFFELSLTCHTNWENGHFEKRVPRTLARRRTPASDRFDRERGVRGIDFHAVGKARIIENRAKIDPHSVRERDCPLLSFRVHHMTGQMNHR
jgi:hypothetical protein